MGVPGASGVTHRAARRGNKMSRPPPHPRRAGAAAAAALTSVSSSHLSNASTSSGTSNNVFITKLPYTSDESSAEWVTEADAYSSHRAGATTRTQVELGLARTTFLQGGCS